MIERSPYTTDALAAAAATSPEALRVLCAREDFHTLQVVRGILGALPPRSAPWVYVRAHPSEAIRACAVVARWGTLSRVSSAQTRRVGESLSTTGVEAILALVHSSYDGTRLLPRPARIALFEGLLHGRSHPADTLLRLLEDAYDERPERALLTIAAARAECDTPAQTLTHRNELLARSEWAGLRTLVVLSARDPAGWAGCTLGHHESVVLLRRACVDELVTALLAGSPVPAALCEKAAALDSSLALLCERLAGSGVTTPPLGVALTEAILQRVCVEEHASPTELLTVLARCGVTPSHETLAEAVGNLAYLVGEFLQASTRAPSAHPALWHPGSVRAGVVAQLSTAGTLTPGSALASIQEEITSALGSGGDPRPSLARLAAFAAEVRTTPLLEEHADDLAALLADTLTNLALPWDLLAPLSPEVELHALDSALADLPRTLAADERVVEVCVAVPYVCDVDDIAGRRRPTAVARRILQRLCDPYHDPFLHTLDADNRRTWRSRAASHCAEFIRLTRAEVGALPWEMERGDRTQIAVGSYLAARLGADARRWEVLASLGDTHDGSIAELVDAVTACL